MKVKEPHKILANIHDMSGTVLYVLHGLLSFNPHMQVLLSPFYWKGAKN